MTLEELRKRIADDKGETVEVKEITGQRLRMVLANVV